MAPNVRAALLGVLAFLVAASGVVAVMRLLSGKARPELEASAFLSVSAAGLVSYSAAGMYTWWVLLGLFMASTWFFGDNGLVAFWTLGAMLGFHVRPLARARPGPEPSHPGVRLRPAFPSY